MPSDDGLRAFLNDTGTTDSGFVLVNPSNPVDWLGLAQAFIGSIVTGTVFGILGVLKAVADAVFWLSHLGRTFVSNWFAALTTEATTYISEMWSFSLGWAGPLAFPVAVGIVLASLWIAARGLAFVREEIANG